MTEGATTPAALLLRRLRGEQGQSLRGAASDLGVAASTLSRIERGEKGLSHSLQTRAAAHYGVSPDLLALADGRVPSDVVAILQRHPELLEVIRRYPANTSDEVGST